MAAKYEEMMKSKGFLPYNLDTLPAKYIQIAKEELGETEEVRRSALEQLRKRILEDKKLKCPTDDKFLIQFLRARKYDVAKTMELLHNYFNLITSNPHIFETLDKEKMDKLASSNFINILPFRDNVGCLVVTIKMGKWDPDDINVEVLFCLALAVVFCLEIYPASQICGVRILFDAKNYSLKHLRSFVPRYVPFIAKALRILFHGDNMQDVHKFIPKEVLTYEYAGDCTSYNFGVIREVDKIYDRFLMMIKTLFS